MTRETDILQAVRLRASQLGALIWRNNVGKLQDKNGRWVTYGLCVGSADLIGLFKGRFLAIECKIPGKHPTIEQANFLAAVNKAGGIGAVITDPAQLENILK